MNKNNQTNNKRFVKENQAEEKSWYMRLHQLTHQPKNTPKQQLNLSIFFRIWFTVALIIVIAGLVVFTQLFNHVEPTAKQVIEDTLVDTGKLLAISLQQPLESGEISSPIYQAKLDKAFAGYDKKPANNRRFADEQTLNILSTWFYQKTHSSFRIYITDAQGIVIYDSLPIKPKKNQHFNAEGQDYSQWNDVYLTLQGKYGARSSRVDEADANTSIMYVSQPILNDNKEIIGVVSVGKPVATILPYLNVARQRMFTTSFIIILISIFLAGLVAWWLQQSIKLVINYTNALASNTKKPSFYLGRELNELSNSIEDMKHRLENRSYVNDYVHTLTHELKSPLTAIKASGELLGNADLDEEDRITLSNTIYEQSQKLQTLIDKLLLLAKVEQPNFQLDSKLMNISELITQLTHCQQANISKHNLNISYLYQEIDLKIDIKTATTKELINYTSDKRVLADVFWLSQALDNILTNAIHFANKNIIIKLSAVKNTVTNKHQLQLKIINDGQLIPEYALTKVFDQYFSLSHQVKRINSQDNFTKNNKGTGLGLTLTKQVIEHHGGYIDIKNEQLQLTEIPSYVGFNKRDESNKTELTTDKTKLTTVDCVVVTVCFDYNQVP